MSRSYHVTRRAAIRAFAEGDSIPAAQASEKAWVKKAETLERDRARTVGHRSKNSTIVSDQKGLTKRVLERRDEEQK
jgi:hypothetical protein